MVSFLFKFRTSLTLCLIAGMALQGFGSTTEKVTRLTKAYGEGEDMVELAADKASYDWSGNWVTFTGDVVVRTKEQELTGDKIRYNLATREAQAEGRVTLTDSSGAVFSGEALNIVLSKKDERPKSETEGPLGGITARLDNIEGIYDPYKIRAKHGGVEDGAFVAEGCYLTTCTNAPGHEHWGMSARKLRLRPGESFSAHGVAPYLFGVPIVYVPYYWRDLDARYGIHVQPGFQSRWGGYLLSSYTLPLYRDRETGMYLDAKTSVDFRSRRGAAAGERFDWDFQEYGAGALSLYGLYDQISTLPDGVNDRNRFRVAFKHAVDVTERDRIFVQAWSFSDPFFQYDFFDREFRRMPQPENVAAYTHRDEQYLVGVMARPRINSFYTQVERLPEAWINFNSTELGDSGIYYEGWSSVVYLRNGRTNAVPAVPQVNVTRFDMRHLLDYPIQLGGVLSLVPRVAWQGTVFSQTYEDGAPGNTASRSLPEAGMEASFKLTGAWQGQSGRSWRHIMEPYANYTYVVRPDVPPEDLYPFDWVDRLGYRNDVRLGTRHRWQYRDNETKRTVEVAYLNVYGDILLDPDKDVGQRALDRLYYESRFYPFHILDIATPSCNARVAWDSQYNVSEKDIDYTSVRMDAWYRRYATSFEYNHHRPTDPWCLNTDLWMASFTMPMTEKWDVNLFGRYESRDKQWQEFGGYLQRNYDCIEFRLIASIFPSYRRADGNKEATDYRIGFMMYLTRARPTEHDPLR